METDIKLNKLPQQPIYVDELGVARFRENPIVRWLLDAGPFDLNQIAMLPNISHEERAQFAQLIGYSVCGYGDLPYAVGVEEADAQAEALFTEWKRTQ
jgi:hypothetical protein